MQIVNFIFTSLFYYHGQTVVFLVKLLKTVQGNVIHIDHHIGRWSAVMLCFYNFFHYLCFSEILHTSQTSSMETATPSTLMILATQPSLQTTLDH